MMDIQEIITQEITTPEMAIQGAIPMPEGVDVTQGDVMHQRDIPADVDIPVMMI